MKRVSRRQKKHGKLPSRQRVNVILNWLYSKECKIVKIDTRHMNKISAADYSKGFGGKYGVQKDRVDKSAVGWDHQEQLGKHESQIGISPIEVPVCLF